MRDLITEMSAHIQTLNTSLREHSTRCSSLESELILTKDALLQTQLDLRVKEGRLKEVIHQFDLQKNENKSLRESCRVLEIENDDLLKSQKRYFLSQDVRDPTDSTLAPTRTLEESNVLSMETSSMPGDSSLQREKEGPVSTFEDSEDTEEARRFEYLAMYYV